CAAAPPPKAHNATPAVTAASTSLTVAADPTRRPKWRVMTISPRSQIASSAAARPSQPRRLPHHAPGAHAVAHLEKPPHPGWDSGNPPDTPAERMFNGWFVPWMRYAVPPI